ncbi:methionine ABC transporter ATP-binding protein [Alkaliphilus transvaalensis]|uniref:methionine ABC transporter ATP-binding protein n=1 Tax=Alkaliphilus transvaalensis TaxID=114628 RepID=UPI00047BD41D|nr:ATP-binding cassette domain-containing protein [Alkaliphilus transvaalensis]
MIKLKNISKTFTTSSSKLVALNNVSLEVRKGEIYGVIGHSGAGKSTLIRCVNLLEKPDSGEVLINGVDLTNLSPKELRESRKRIGMIFQGFNLLKTATVFDNIAIPLKLTGVDKAEINKRVEKYLAIVGLENKHGAYPSQLSGGQKQRVAIARALAHEPEILLSDEATSALDPETTDAILELLLKINRELGITILLITHEMNVIQKVCDRLAVMENGVVVEEGSLLEIYASPKHETTKKFINSQFPNDLPKGLIQQERKVGEVITLSFVGEVTSQPILAALAKEFHVYPNILSGSIIQLKEHQYGRLIVNIQGDGEETAKAVAYLKDRNIQIEEVKGNDLEYCSI